MKINRSNKPKVLCFGRFCDDIPGGMSRHVENLFLALSDQVDFIHLVPSRDRSSACFNLNGVPVIRTPSLNLDGSLVLSPKLLYEAFRLHRQYSFDLVHLHFPDPMSHLASLCIPSSVPRVITWHCDVIRQKKLMRLYRPLVTRALEKAYSIVVSTPAHISSSKDLSRFPSKEKIECIPYGFDFSRFVERHPSASDIRKKFPGKLIFSLGRHVYYKGYDVLIDAMGQIDDGTQLLLGGKGPLTEELRLRAEKNGVSGKVQFLGHIPEDELPAYYQACDLFCLPSVSRAEAFGIVQVEAMASGKAVVSTILENGVDYVNQNGLTGFTVPPNNAVELANAISNLLGNDDLRQKMGEAGRLRVQTKFSLTKMAESTLDLYKRATSG